MISYVWVNIVETARVPRVTHSKLYPRHYYIPCMPFTPRCRCRSLYVHPCTQSRYLSHIQFLYNPNKIVYVHMVRSTHTIPPPPFHSDEPARIVEYGPPHHVLSYVCVSLNVVDKNEIREQRMCICACMPNKFRIIWRTPPFLPYMYTKNVLYSCSMSAGNVSGWQKAACASFGYVNCGGRRWENGVAWIALAG